MLEIPDETQLANVLGTRWWFHFGKALCEVIMSEDFYKVGPPADRQFDSLGLKALERDWAVWATEPSEDLIQRSQFNLFHDIGVQLFGHDSGRAMNYAIPVATSATAATVSTFFYYCAPLCCCTASMVNLRFTTETPLRFALPCRLSEVRPVHVSAAGHRALALPRSRVS